MKTAQFRLAVNDTFEPSLAALQAGPADLALVFAPVAFFQSERYPGMLQQALAGMTIIGCSTAGEIAVDRVYDQYCIITTIKFDATPCRAVGSKIGGMADSFAAGARLAAALPADDLTAVLVFGTGVAINGSALVSGLQSRLAPSVKISGGLAADDGAFRQTWTLGPDGAADDQVVALGLYGTAIRLNYGSFAGWEPFGPARKVTRCHENVLYELDGERALDIYKRYLGEYAKDLPGSGLLFPFEMLGEQKERAGIFRTILGVDEASGSLTLAGDIDANGYLKLMHSSTDKLIEGAETAAKAALQTGDGVSGDALAILVSCIGRKLVMGDRVDEEVEAVANTLGKNTTITGFYSNGEIAGTAFHGECRLHNQTMTITWLYEHA